MYQIKYLFYKIFLCTLLFILSIIAFCLLLIVTLLRSIGEAGRLLDEFVDCMFRDITNNIYEEIMK